MIDSQGRLEIPLYHGTSNLFIDSIKKNGLGGHRDDQLFDLKILCQLSEALSEPINRTEWWELMSNCVEPVLSQRVTDGGFNFRHGGTYLTPAKSKAREYALSNALGSELLSITFQAFTALYSVNPSEAERIIPSDHRLRIFFNKTHSPVVITIKKINTEMLKTETGEDINDQINLMINMRNEFSHSDLEVLWGCFNFELKEVAIEFPLLNIEYIKK